MGMKLLCVVEMDFIWDATNRPFKGLEPAVRKPRILPQYALRENEGHGYDTGRFQGKIEAGDDPSCHIYCERDPWAADWQSIPFIENDQVHWTAIDLKKLEGKCRLSICVNWSERLPGCPRPEPGFRRLLRIVLGKPLFDRPIIRSLHFDSSAFLSDPAGQCSE
jgi:hypothetical protein